jgi:type II secretory pathway pseudopilin PulG
MNVKQAISPVQGARRREWAFTMVEIALALAVIGFALVAIIGVLPTGMSVQKDNREETIIGLDATFLMDTIRTGSRGQDSLTNYIICITNRALRFDALTNPIPGSETLSWFTTSQYSLSNNPPVNANLLTNGQNIIGLLCAPRYDQEPGGGFISNYTTADFRSMSGAVISQGLNPASREFAFAYRLTPQLIRFNAFDTSWTNFADASIAGDTNLVASRSNFMMMANMQRQTFNELRLRFDWPVFVQGTTGNGHQTFRTAVSGQLNFLVPSAVNGVAGLWFVRPQLYPTPIPGQ